MDDETTISLGSSEEYPEEPTLIEKTIPPAEKPEPSVKVGTPHPAQTTTTPSPVASGKDEPTPPAEPATGETIDAAVETSAEVKPLK